MFFTPAKAYTLNSDLDSDYSYFLDPDICEPSPLHPECHSWSFAKKHFKHKMIKRIYQLKKAFIKTLLKLR